ncbi:hypothetical protein DJ82_01760 [Halorubrum sp. Ib24]|uniref:DUF7473 family protein n=1 Tax=unclassified Halorubrum TaxID=2642239 RepID=UPI000B996E75|nr:MULTISPECIES: hypothetical protein [unclassified Halorubrum]OYR42765.1 hypothetical protein DJ82_01760 [Halorubrum sp. Ib24]OYR48193.1 hypothetical protein DJ74_11100 [Halorubrum sp. Ea8]OYR49017.1 hypothetical protein DJ73_18390 [Halorubrum sp. Ea1]
MLLQTVTPITVLGTTILFALFLSVTAHLAARNVLGDVDPRRALYVGPLPAVIGVVGGAFAVSEALLVPAALLVDGAMFAWSYDQPRRVVAGMTVIHAVITTLLSIVLFGITALLATMPG